MEWTFSAFTSCNVTKIGNANLVAHLAWLHPLPGLLLAPLYDVSSSSSSSKRSICQQGRLAKFGKLNAPEKKSSLCARVGLIAS